MLYSVCTFLAMTVVEFIDAICKILTFNCTKMRLAAGLRPDPLGSLQRSPDPYLDFKGRGRERRGRKGEWEGGEGGKGERKGPGRDPLTKKAGYGPDVYIYS